MIILEIVKLRGSPIGIVAATSKKHIGYALYNAAKEKRKWDLGRAAVIAVGRAEKGRDPMVDLFDLSEMFRLEMKKYESPSIPITPKDFINFQNARSGFGRVFYMTKAVGKMILKAKKMRW